jgi:hypothetical protein
MTKKEQQRALAALERIDGVRAAIYRAHEGARYPDSAQIIREAREQLSRRSLDW